MLAQGCAGQGVPVALGALHPVKGGSQEQQQPEVLHSGAGAGEEGGQQEQGHRWVPPRAYMRTQRSCHRF